jgi:DeoR family transcriptional regulator, aga operon transcriptional repressor
MVTELLPTDIRRDRIVEVVHANEFVTVARLSALFGISEVTVRSDLDVLAAEGRLRRVRGGAFASSGLRSERPFEEAQAAFAEEKAAIGRAAASLVSSGETLILDVGTTTTALATALVRREELRDIVVLTNAVNVALELERAASRITVVLTGGTLRPLQHSLVNPLGGLILRDINAHTVFLGCNGIDPDGGITNINLPEAEIKRLMLGAARQRIVLADGSKVGHVALAHLCPVGDVDRLITGQSASPEVVGRLVERGLEVQIVE